MSEIENVENPENETEENSSTADVVNTDKKYSEKDVQRMVQDRLKREKVVSKKLADDFEAEKSQYIEQISKYEDILSKDVEKRLADYPEFVRSLVSKLSLLDQIEWLSDEKNRISKKEFPQRKQAEGNTEETPPKKKLNIGI